MLVKVKSSIKEMCLKDNKKIILPKPKCLCWQSIGRSSWIKTVDPAFFFFLVLNAKKMGLKSSQKAQVIIEGFWSGRNLKVALSVGDGKNRRGENTLRKYLCSASLGQLR